MSQAQADPAIQRAIDFLAQAQLPDGEFVTFIAPADNPAKAEWDSSPFVTSLVTYSLGHAGAGARPLIERALSFLTAEMEPGGVWRYYSSKQVKHLRIGPDLDDTACASFVLLHNGRSVPSNRWIFLANTDARGLFCTWLLPTPGSDIRLLRVLAEGHRIAEAKVAPRFRSHRDPTLPGEVDAVVNANVVLYLGECEETTAAIRYLLDLLQSEPERYESHYYADVVALYYMVARACANGVPSLTPAGDAVTRKIEERVRSRSLGSPLASALAACALLTFAPRSNALPQIIESIREAQNADGSWDRAIFYRGPTKCWGSETLTTALCLEALARHGASS